MINATGSVNFTGRCPEIKQGQWVSHAVNAYLPHRSVTRYQPLVDSTLERTKLDSQYQSSFELYPKRVLAILDRRRKLHNEMFDAREYFVSTPEDGTYYHAVAPIEQLLETKLGNCHENARAAETILRANGVKYPAVCHLYIGGFNADHVVCAFNRDGSQVKAIKNNKTIIVDPWVGIVDFANNAIMKYKTMLDSYVAKGKTGKATLQRIEEHPMTQKDIMQFKERFPQLIQTKRPD